MSYKDAFAPETFPEGAVEATKKLAKRLWKKDLSKELKAMNINKWIETMCCLYQLPQPIFIFSENKEMYEATGGGVYMPAVNTFFVFSKFSLVTIMHEFRHFMQHKQQELVDMNMDATAKEEDARGWSVSLFYIAKPEAYQKAVDEGKLHFA